MDKLKKINIELVILIATFVILLAPFALNYNFYYPDEMYYSDSSIKMIQSNDYLTPRLGNNELRFKKPILTYWTIVASYKLFGISPFSTRLFFLLAGALTVFLVYRITKLISENSKASVIAAAIIASNVTLIISSARAIPDILLALTTTLSALGIAGLIKYGNDAPKKYLWFFYLGIALAIEVKGIPGLMLGGLAFLYLLFNPWQRIKFKKFLHLPSLIISIAIAASWFVSVYIIHKDVFLDAFFNDQVGMRVASKLLTSLKNGGLAIGCIIGLFLPWNLFLFAKKEKDIQSNTEKNFQVFTIIWTIAIIIMTAMVFRFYERYLLPVFPVIAAELGIILNKRIVFSQKGSNVLLIVLFILSIITWGFALFLTIGISPHFQYLWVFIPALFLCVFIFFRSLSSQSKYMYIAIFIILLFFNISLNSARISFPLDGKQITQTIQKENIPANEPIGFIGNLHIASKTRIILGCEYNLINCDTIASEITQYQYIVVEDTKLKKIDLDSYTTTTASVNWRHINVLTIIRSILNKNYFKTLQSEGEYYYLLERKE